MNKPRPNTPKPSPANPYLPTEPVDGYRGFYPAPGKEPLTGPGRLPLPIKAVTWDPQVKAVRASMMFRAVGIGDAEPVFHNIKVELSPKDAIRHLFCSTGVTLDHLQVVWADSAVPSFASWRQDTRTGAFAIFAGTGNSHTPCIRQGGYNPGKRTEADRDILPNIKWLDESYGRRWDNWSMDSNYNNTRPEGAWMCGMMSCV